MRDVSEKDSFGETALMYAETSDVSVIATADAKLWTLDRDTFRALQLSAAARGEEEKEEEKKGEKGEEKEKKPLAGEATDTA